MRTLPNDLFQVAFPSPALQTFELQPSWVSALSKFDSSQPGFGDDSIAEANLTGYVPQPTVAMVRGSRRTGKSTLARTVVNRLLTRFRRVSFLECDLGQTEFTPPGLVALHVLHQPVFGEIILQQTVSPSDF